MSPERVAAFDFDMTLLDTSTLRVDRDARNWPKVKHEMPRLHFDQAILDALRTISARGVKLAVASSAPRWYIDAFVGRMGLPIDMVLGNRDAARLAKPTLSYRAKIKAGQLIHLKSLFVDAKLVFVGDDNDDATGAHAAGVTFVHACWGGPCAGISGTHGATPDSLANAVLKSIG